MKKYMERNRKIIVLMPVKNEAWILRVSLAAASVWADQIIVSDQGSTDGSKDIARSFSKVYLIENDCLQDFDEYKMREPMISKARELYGAGNILIALDADELLTPYFDSEDFLYWQKLSRGTIIQFFWGNIKPKSDKYWSVYHQNFGYVDDGRVFETGQIHVPRLFTPQGIDDVYECKDLGVMHFQYVDWDRMKSKHRWYQCYERINFPTKNAVDIYRRYHHMYNPTNTLYAIPKEWRENYLKANVDIANWNKESVYWWDYKVVSYLETYGTRYFSQIDIWTFDWKKVTGKKYRFNGSVGDIALLIYLRMTMRLIYLKGWRRFIRKIDEQIKYRLDYGNNQK